MKRKTDRRKLSKYNIFALLQDYRFNSILVRSFVLILTVLLLAFLGITMLVRNEMNRILTREIGGMSVQTLEKTRERIDSTVHEVEQIAAQLSLDSDIRLFLLPGQQSDRGTMLRAKEKLEMYAGISDYIDSIYVYSSKNRTIVTTEDGGGIDTFSDLTWYDNLVGREYEPARVICRLKENRFPYVMSYLQPVRLTQMQFLGGVIINIDMDKLGKLAISEQEDYSEKLIILDNRNNCIFSSDQSDLQKRFNELSIHGELDMQKEGYQFIGGEEESIAATASSGLYDWKYISMVSMQKYYEDTYNTKAFYILLGSIIVILSLLSSMGIALYCYMPVKNILQLMENPNMGEALHGNDLGLRKDEVREIGLNIVRNLYSNQKMKEEMDQYVQIINKAQVTALQAQISPHFLYNTLENIRWRAIGICNGDNEVSQIILNLSQMLRISLDNEKMIITIEEEIQNAKLYIEILQLRYENKLKVLWDVEESVLKLPIVKVCLQPLIENAVYHGIKPKRGNGTIKITIQKLAHSVQIRIQDDGVGMNPEEVRMLNEMMSEKYLLNEDHIGICNINQRIKLLLNHDAALKIKSTLHYGTTVELEIPWKGEASSNDEKHG